MLFYAVLFNLFKYANVKLMY